jgi:hypothetical protein
VYGFGILILVGDLPKRCLLAVTGPVALASLFDNVVNQTGFTGDDLVVILRRY